MIRRRLLMGVAAALPLLIRAESRILYRESFDGADGGPSPAARGWRIHATPEQSRYEVREGRLEITCLPVNYNGGYAEVEVPVCRRGMLEFDANIAIGNPANAHGTALTMDLYNIGLLWHDYCRDWRRYFPEPVARRMPGFSLEPVGHQSLAGVEKGKWMHYRVVFDTDSDLVEYYLDDMEDPVFIDSGVPVLGRAEWQGGRIRFANMGLMPGPVTYAVDNLVLTDLGPAAQEAGDAREGILVFRGLVFERLRLAEAMAGVPGARRYTAVSWRSSDFPKNSLKLDRMPGAARVARARAFLLADMPAGPDAILPPFLLRQIAESVAAGARLVVLGGLFSLEKGCYRGTALEQILPVGLVGPFDGLRRLEQPLTLTAPPGAAGEGLAWAEEPVVLYRHDLPLHAEAEVLIRSGDTPLLVRRRIGKGDVLVFLGAPCGVPAAGQTPFWAWRDWPRFLRQLTVN